jgi:hypothetical protein
VTNPCSPGVTLTPNTLCTWAVQYMNHTGSGTSFVFVTIDAPDGAHAEGIAAGIGA